MDLLQIAGAFGGAFGPVATLLAFWAVSLRIQALQSEQKALSRNHKEFHERLNRLEARHFK